MIKSADLLKVWAAPDNSRLTGKQYSFRLPVHVAAKLAALEEMYAHRTRTAIVNDLLAAALDEVEKSFPFVAGRVAIPGDPDDGEPDYYEDAGMGAVFRKLANKHYQEIEKEMGNKDTKPLYDSPVLGTKDQSDAK